MANKIQNTTEEQNNNNSGIPQATNHNTISKYNVQNLKPFNKTDNILSKEEAKRRGRQGGINSGKARKERKSMRETLQEALTIELDPDKLEELGADISLLNGNNTVLSAIVASTIREAINGDPRSIQFIRDSIGEQPKTEIVQEVISKEDLQVIDDLKGMLTG